MSMVTTACPVCQQLYSVGVVGSGVVGGHTCPVKTALVHAGEALHTIAADISDYETPEQGVEWRVKFAHETSLAIEALDIGRLEMTTPRARSGRPTSPPRPFTKPRRAPMLDLDNQTVHGDVTMGSLRVTVNAYAPEGNERDWSFQLGFGPSGGCAVTFSGLDRESFAALRDQIDAVLAAASPSSDLTKDVPDAR